MICSMIVKPDTSSSIGVRALLLGQRLETRGLERQGTIALAPLTLRIGQTGVAFLFRYGVVVLAGLSPEEESDFVESLRPRVTEALATPEIDQVSAVLKADGEDQIEPSGVITLRDASPERLQIVATVMSKSVVLALNESQIAAAFDRIEPLAAAIRQWLSEPGLRAGWRTAALAARENLPGWDAAARTVLRIVDARPEGTPSAAGTSGGQ